MKRFLLCLLFLPLGVFGQQLNLSIDHESGIFFQKAAQRSQATLHTGLKPLVEADFRRVADTDSVLYALRFDSLRGKNRGVLLKWGRQQIRSKNLISLHRGNLELYINPLLHWAAAFNTETSDWVGQGKGISFLSANTRGVQVKANIGDKFSFYSDFRENQSFFVDYVDDYIRQQVVVPGVGVPRKYEGIGHDFSSVSGYLSFAPLRFMNVQLGHGKHFVGEGYRSLLLSDNSYYYPYLKFSLEFSTFKYYLLFSEFLQFETDYWGYSSGELAYRNRKHGAFHYLSWIPHPRFELGLFEGTVWKTSDTATVRQFDWGYFNPLILGHTLQNGLDNENNVVLGLNLKFKVSEQIQLYGQAMLDGTQKFDKYGYQTGIKVFDAFHNKLKGQNLFLQAEYNHATPYSYAHDTPRQSYTHLNQPLAHPLGADFSELFGRLHYTFRYVVLEARLAQAQTRISPQGLNTGADPFRPDSEAAPNSPTTNAKITNASLRVAYLLNPRTNLQFFVAFHKRTLQAQNTQNTQYISLGLKTALRNVYHDF